LIPEQYGQKFFRGKTTSDNMKRGTVKEKGEQGKFAGRSLSNGRSTPTKPERKSVRGSRGDKEFHENAIKHFSGRDKRTKKEKGSIGECLFGFQMRGEQISFQRIESAKKREEKGKALRKKRNMAQTRPFPRGKKKRRDKKYHGFADSQKEKKENSWRGGREAK